MQQNRHPYHKSNHVKDKSEDKFKENYDQLQNAWKNYDAVEIIKTSKACANALLDVEASQLRKFLDEIIKVNPKIDFDNPQLNSPLTEDLIIKLSIMRPRFLYSAARKKGKLLEFYNKVLDPKLEIDVKKFTFKDLQFLHLFIESLVAYHKAHQNKK